MDPSARLEAIFLRAREIISPQECAAYLDQACAGAAKLRADVERLLLAQAKAGNFLEAGHSPPTEFHERLPPAEMPGSRIGPYKLLQQIGEGGMGTVFMAEQIEPVKRLAGRDRS